MCVFVRLYKGFTYLTAKLCLQANLTRFKSWLPATVVKTFRGVYIVKLTSYQLNYYFFHFKSKLLIWCPLNNC